MKPLYLTTAIDYVNAKPHVGHAVEKIQADVVARYYRARGRDVFAITGTDENSLKNVLAAQKVGKEVRVFVDENVAAFQRLRDQLNLSFDDFIRTTEERHIRGAQKFWKLFKSNDIYKKRYRGLYCVGCEEFKFEKDLALGKCPEHNLAPEPIEEENYFFRLSAYQNQLEELIKSDRLLITPANRKNEVLQFIRGGLSDISISRSKQRAHGWGVPVPGDDSQIMYVWVDALSNYITALDYAHEGERYQKFWASDGERIHLIGKGIIRFHAIYWPAFLLSAGLPLPTQIVSHEYLTIEGAKISKTLGNVIDPTELVKKFGVDATRYLLLVSLPAGGDGDISLPNLEARYTADLVNDFGNLVQRTLVLRQKLGVTVSKGAAPSCAGADDHTEKFEFAEGLEEIWNLIRTANGQLDREAPWAQSDPAKQAATLTTITRQLETVATALAPYLPNTAAKLAKQLATGQPEPLFPRLPPK